MKHYNVRDKLIGATVQVIAADGLDKATTKNIAKEAGLYETYIYQYFSSKENLYAETFHMLDDELVYVIMKNLSIFNDTQRAFSERAKEYFDVIWGFMVGTPDKCTVFVRYYYSPYFNKYSVQYHNQLYAPLKEKCRLLFKAEADVNMLLRYMLSTMSMFVQTVIDGNLEDNENSRKHVFGVIYNAISPYFK